jgi:hypothetical protein
LTSLQQQLEFANTFIRLYLPIPLVVFAFVGTTLSFLIMQRKKHYSKNATCLYMQVLAIWDSLNITFNTLQRFIVFVVPSVMDVIGNVYCKQLLFMAHMSTLVSFWLLVFMTFDRAIAVMLPLQATTLCTRRKAIVTSVVTCVVVALGLIPDLTRYYVPNPPVDRSKCPFYPEWLHLPLYIFVVFIGIFPPPVLVLSLNACIMVALYRGKRERRSMTSSGGPESTQKQTNFENQINIMLLLVSWTFLMLTSFYIVDYVYWEIMWPPVSLTQRLARKVSFEVMLYLLCCSNGINFYLYYFVSARFRRDLKDMVFPRGSSGWKMSEPSRAM